ncbi:MAG TPA: SDR family oxidoreductase [Gemmatimonadaceae bacterium]|nr:SDR family oxidoreductase [Gemmatimonadaceae bacterium]
MKIIVIGGTGLIGSKIVTKLLNAGFETVAASRHSGVDTMSGQGLAGVLAGASAVIDVSSPPSYDGISALEFFETSTRNLLEAEAASGVRHHVALSVVGTERLSESGYMRAKLAQEKLIKAGSIPYSIVAATQFFESIQKLAGLTADSTTVRVPPVLIQPVAGEDVASVLAEVGAGDPLDTTIEVAGPEQFRADELARRRLKARHDSREVVVDPQARFFGAIVNERTLLPADGAHLATTRFDEWLAGSVQRAYATLRPPPPRMEEIGGDIA